MTWQLTLDVQVKWIAAVTELVTLTLRFVHAIAGGLVLHVISVIKPFSHDTTAICPGYDPMSGSANCNRRGTCANSVCSCDMYWSGASCSVGINLAEISLKTK